MKYAMLTLLLVPRLASAETLGTALRALAAAAKTTNAVTAAPLRPAPAWQPNTHYELGGVVSSNGNTYICRSAGTSGGGSGPTGMGSPTIYSDITDGSAEWEYYPTTNPTTPDAAAPAVTASSTLPGDLTKHGNPWTGSAPNTQAFAFGGGDPVLNPTRPGTQVSFPAVSVNTAHTGGNIGMDSGYSGYHWSASFVTDAPKLAIGVSYAATPANIIIDGRRLFPGGWQGAGDGNPSYFILDFTAAGGRKSRVITIEDFGNISFAGVWTDSTSTVQAPTTPKPIQVAVFGSSIECGGNGFPLRADLGWPAQVGKLLGWHDVRNLGLGGTGYINNQGGSSLRYLEHIDDATDFSPDLVIVGGPINDATQSRDALRDATSAFLGALRTALPDAPIIVLGTFMAASGPSQLSIDAEVAVRDAVNARADARTFFIPLSTAASPFITGTGNNGAPSGTGNADLYISDDGTHPNQPGNDRIATTYASAIALQVIAVLDPEPPSEEPGDDAPAPTPDPATPTGNGNARPVETAGKVDTSGGCASAGADAWCGLVVAALALARRRYWS